MEQNSEELGLGDYVALFRRRWPWVAGTIVLVVGLVAIISFTREATYSSRAVVEVLTEENQALFQQRDDELFREPIAELAYFRRDQYLDAVEEAAGFRAEVDAELLAQASAQKTEEINVIALTVEAPEAELARIGAEAAAETYLQARLDEFRTAFSEQLEAVETTRANVAADRRVINEELEEARLAVDAAVSEIDRLAADSTYQLLVAERQPTLNGLSSQIGRLDVRIAELRGLLVDLEDPESIGVLLRRPEAPSSPISPDIPRNIVLAVVVSLIVGAILAILRDLLDSRPFDGAELARLVETPVMATIGEIRSERSAPGRIKRFADLSPKELQGYQVLLNSLWLSNVSNPLQSIVFSSDRAGVGKTQTVVNVAQAEASRGTRVLVIDTDFANPSVVDRLELEHRGMGLTDLLAGHAAIEDVLIPTHLPTLHVIDCAQSDSASDLLRSDRFGLALEQLSDAYDLIIVDAMPTLGTSDSRLVALQADAVVVVYDPADSRREELQLTIDLLRNSGANLVGLVANRSRASHPIYLAGQRGRDKERALL